jgi:hypothetical protein
LANRFDRMNWHHRASPVGMLEKMMTSLDAQHCEPGATQGRNHLTTA